MNARERFNDKWIPEPNSGCWIWTGAIWGNNYGGFRFDGKMQNAHRVAWQLYCGAIPDGLLVLHKCDTPTCVNPDHLYIGNHSDNTQDMIKRGRVNRQPRTVGEKNSGAKLTTSQVIEIREAHGTHEAIASRFGIKAAQVGRIRNGTRWKHIKLGERK